MTVSDVGEIVEAAHINPLHYSFESEQHESLCLLAFGQTWKVFFSERGQRFDQQAFPTEDEACVYFLKQLFQHEIR